MKFRIPSVDRAAIAVDFRVESFGRFGNYFFATGWVSDCAGKPPQRSYQFAGQSQPTLPEYSYLTHHPGDPARTCFFDLFWVNDGCKLVVGPSHPIVACLLDPKKPEPIRKLLVQQLAEGDLRGFLNAMKSVGSREVWTNRITFEIVNHCNDEDRAMYVAVAIERIGWHTMSEDVMKRLAPKERGEDHPDYLAFLCTCISGFNARDVPTEVLEKFIELTESLRISKSDRRLTQEVVKQLARIDPDKACGFAHSMITALEHDRAQLADCMRHCFPQHSQWWIHHTLLNDQLGPEQVADALNCAGTAAATEGRRALAMLCYEAARMIGCAAQSPAWNAGWLRFENGDVQGAADCFKLITRHYTHQSLSTRWPHAGNMPWPSAPMGAALFTLPPGVTKWPRISIVTPSYNQGCYIEETILSVLHQGYPNLQYIIVDGNSTDGTREVLERYRDRLDHLIIEPDNGQTEAINKGLRLVDGELVAWLNSDDLYAPGALHVAALRWLENHADLIAGVCIEHMNRGMLLFNKPAASDCDFNPPQLARIFTYWLKGFYFYQPELFFSKRMLDKAGLLDESLYYSMDYDLWMRFSRAGASLEVVDWPFAFFRKHDAQKTSNLVDCIEEQATVRDRYVELAPDELRTSQVRRMADSIRRCPDPVLGVVSSRLQTADFAPAQSGKVGKFRVVTSSDGMATELAAADFILLLVHGKEDLKMIGHLRGSGSRAPVAGWFLNSRHDVFTNHAVAEAVDIVIPAHAAYQRYLRNDHAFHWEPVPPCVTRWNGRQAADWFQKSGRGNRHGNLFLDTPPDHPEGSPPAVRIFIEEITSLIERAGGSVDRAGSRHRMSDESGAGEFKRRCGHVASLVLPAGREIPEGLFEALLGGQIPLVPDDVTDLDRAIPPEMQQSLPVIRFSRHDPKNALDALQTAIHHHARDGADGAARRHRYALEFHLFQSRVASILDRLDRFRPAARSSSAPAPAPIASAASTEAARVMQDSESIVNNTTTNG